MHAWALDHLACPRTGSPLELRDAEERGGEIVSGRLVAADGVAYPIVRGVPRLSSMRTRGRVGRGGVTSARTASAFCHLNVTPVGRQIALASSSVRSMITGEIAGAE